MKQNTSFLNISHQENVTEQKIYEIMDWMFENYKSIKNLDDIISKTNLSRKYFITVFKKYTKETPLSFLNKLKLVEAKKLLETTDLPINQIAKICGFTSSNTFTKLFISKFDTNPKLYRNSKI